MPQADTEIKNKTKSPAHSKKESSSNALTDIYNVGWKQRAWLWNAWIPTASDYRNCWKPSDRNEEERCLICLYWKSGLVICLAFEVAGFDLVVECVTDRDLDRFALTRSFVMLVVPGSLMNETIACRQRGHATDPGGPCTVADVLFVEQRYNAQVVQNSWWQPAEWEEYFLKVICYLLYLHVHWSEKPRKNIKKKRQERTRCSMIR